MKDLLLHIEKRLHMYAIKLCNDHKQDGEDLLHNTILKVAKVYNSHLQHKPFDEQCKMATLLMRNYFIDQVRRKKRKKFAIEYPFPIHDFKFDQLADISEEENIIDHPEIMEFLISKSYHQQSFEILFLFNNGYSIKQLCVIFNKSVNGITSSLFNARHQIKRHFNINGLKYNDTRKNYSCEN